MILMLIIIDCANQTPFDYFEDQYIDEMLEVLRKQHYDIMPIESILLSLDKTMFDRPDIRLNLKIYRGISGKEREQKE